MRPHQREKSDLDARVLHLLTGVSAVAGEIVDELGGVSNNRDYRDHRAIDRALQRLRKRGQIVFDRETRRWNIAKKPRGK